MLKSPILTLVLFYPVLWLQWSLNPDILVISENQGFSNVIFTLVFIYILRFYKPLLYSNKVSPTFKNASNVFNHFLNLQTYVILATFTYFMVLQNPLIQGKIHDKWFRLIFFWKPVKHWVLFFLNFKFVY